MQQIDLGRAVIEPSEPVVAGSLATLTFTYTAGHPIDDTGYLKLAFRFASDFGTPQFDAPQRPNYCSVATTGDCRIECRWDLKGHTRPWGRCLFLKVMGGFLDRGQTISVVFGDRSAGSPGWQMQTFCEDTFEFKTLVDPIATYEFKELPQSPTLRIVAGSPARAVCIAPSEVRLGEGFTYYIKLEDRWGNPVTPPAAWVHPGFNRTGICRFTAADPATGLSAASNPIRTNSLLQPRCGAWCRETTRFSSAWSRKTGTWCGPARSTWYGGSSKHSATAGRMRAVFRFDLSASPWDT